MSARTKEEAEHAWGVGGAAVLKHREDLHELGDNTAGDQLVRLAQGRSASRGGAELRAAAAHKGVEQPAPFPCL